MTTYETLKTYKDKCEVALGQVVDGLVEAHESIKLLEKQQIAIQAQIETLDDLMNVEENPPIVEVPLVAPEDIEEMFDKRMETHDGSSPEGVYAARQDNVYRGEAMAAVEVLDAANRAKSEES